MIVYVCMCECVCVKAGFYKNKKFKKKGQYVQYHFALGREGEKEEKEEGKYIYQNTDSD